MHTYSMELGGRTLTMEIGKIAKQAMEPYWFVMAIPQ